MPNRTAANTARTGLTATLAQRTEDDKPAKNTGRDFATAAAAQPLRDLPSGGANDSVRFTELSENVLNHVIHDVVALFAPLQQAGFDRDTKGFSIAVDNARRRAALKLPRDDSASAVGPASGHRARGRDALSASPSGARGTP